MNFSLSIGFTSLSFKYLKSKIFQNLTHKKIKIFIESIFLLEQLICVIKQINRRFIRARVGYC